jgi:hypothetical protein
MARTENTTTADGKKAKKKKSLFRRILKWTGITLFVLILAMILIPIFFKDQIKAIVLKEVNKSLKADVSLGDFDLTLLSTFPNLTVQLDSVGIVGTSKEFKGVQLAKIGKIKATVGLWDVIGGDQIEVDEVHIQDATFDVRVDPNGAANYDIVKSEEEKTPEEKEEPSAFKLSLQEYTLENVNLKYDDQAGDMYAEIKNLNHEGSGDLTAEVIDFVTSTSMDELTFEMDGMTYASKVKTKADVNLLMELRDKASKFTLKDNKFQLNNFGFEVKGFYEMLADHANMDVELKTKEAEFKDILSLVPTFYQSGYEKMVAKAKVKLKGLVQGRMDDRNMPGWDFGVNVNNATIQYPGYAAIRNVSVDAGSKFAGGPNMDLMTVDVNRFHADFVGNLIDATLKMRNPMTDPLVDSKLLARMNLATLGQVMPLDKGETYNGKLNADVAVNGRMSALEKGNYEAFKAAGTVELLNLLYKTTDLPQQVDVARMLLRFTPQNLALEQLNAKMGNSDFALSGRVDNYMGYVFRDELLKGDFNFNSNNIDLDQLMNVSPAPAASANTSSAQPAPADPDAEPVLIPENVDFNLNTNIGKVRYNGIDIEQVKGNVNMKEEVASLNNMTMKTMGGTVGLRGSYNSKDHNKPGIDFGYDLKELDIQSLTKSFLTIGKLAPVAKYAQGKISSSLTMKSSLTKSLEPIFSTLTGGGDLFTNMVTISGFEPLKKLSDEIKMPKVATQTLKDLKAKFSFANGKVSVKPFNIKMSGIDTRIEGTTSFEQDLDYKMTLNVPKELIPQSMIKLAEQGMAKVNGMIPGIKVASIPDIIPVNALIGGTVTKPKITTDFRDAILKATGNLKDNLKDQANQLVNKAKDSIKGIVNDKVNEVREDLNAKKKELLDKAQKQADAAKAEGKKAADALRAESERRAQELVKEVGSNPLKKKAAEAAANKIRKETEEKAQKLEATANAKADGIMNKAREDAEKIK